MKLRSPRKLDILALLISGVLAIFLIGLMESLFEGIKKERYEERWQSKLAIVNNRCEEEEFFVNDERGDYQKRLERIVKFFETLDQNPYIFSAVYDSNYNLVTERQPRFVNYPFIPFEYDEIVKLMEQGDRGVVTVPYIVGKDTYDMRFYFRLTPLVPGKYVYVAMAIPYISQDIEVASNLTYLVLFITLAAAIAGITLYSILFLNSFRPRYVRLLKPGDKE